jgi:hypothetical protein
MAAGSRFDFAPRASYAQRARPGHRRRAFQSFRDLVTTLLLIAAGLILIVLFAWLRERRLRRKPQLLTEILDLADALERELLECRARLREIPALAASLSPSEQLSARATLAAEPQVQDALRDLLAHRLWLKEHAEQASIDELVSARDALAVTRTSLAAQLARLANVRADFEQIRTAQR